MEGTSVSVRLMMVVFVLLVEKFNHRYSAVSADFPGISPDRRQFYEYETVHISCEEFSGVAEWRVMHKLHKKSSKNSSDCSVPAPSCTIHLTFESHSGEYWCEDVEGNTSQSIDITVTAGPLILEVPASPVLEESDLILHCRNKKYQSGHMADLYKDGVQLGTMYGGNAIIKNVSKFDAGNYKCKISGGGESPESWLSVLKQSNKSIDKIPPDPHRPPHRPSSNPPSLLWIVVGVITPLLVMGLFLYQKHKEPNKSKSKSSLPEDSAIYSSVYYRPLTED